MHWVAITQYFLAGLKRPDLCCLILWNFHVYNIYGGLSPIIITANKLVLVDILLDAYSKQPLFFTTGNFKKGKKPHTFQESR